MAAIVSASVAQPWPLYSYLRHASTTTTLNGISLTSVYLENDDPTLNFLDRRIYLFGTGINTDATGAVTNGSINRIRFTGLTGAPVQITFDFSPDILAVDIFAAIVQFSSSGGANSTLLDALFANQAYTYNGASGDDLFDASDLADTLKGNKGDDALYGNAGNDTIDGGDGDDILDGGTGDDTLIGGKGEDWITTGFAGKNIVSGGDGADTIYFQGDADTLTFAAAKKAVGVDLEQGIGTLGEALDDTYVLFAGNGLTVVGSKFNDVLLGSSKADVLEGGLGNDMLMGRAGGDTLDGGLGIDTASYAESPSFGGVGVIIDMTLPTQVGSPGHGSGDKLISIENLIGSDFGDELSGDTNANRLEGSAGNDFLEGRGGADVLIGGDGWDTARYTDSASGVTVNLGLKTAQKSAGDANGDILSSIEHVVGSLHADTLIGDTGDNELYGNDGDDVLCGGLGNNLLSGGGDSDTADYTKATGPVTATMGAGGTGTATWKSAVDTFDSIENVTGSNYSDTLGGNGEANVIKGGGGHDKIFGNGDADELYGGAGNDTIFGGDGTDELFGEAGKDFLDGGPGDDKLTGGLGRDVFIASSGVDEVQDFLAGPKGDYVDLRLLGLAHIGEAFALLSQVGSDVEIDLGGGDRMVLLNTSLDRMSGSNFIIR